MRKIFSSAERNIVRISQVGRWYWYPKQFATKFIFKKLANETGLELNEDETDRTGRQYTEKKWPSESSRVSGKVDQEDQWQNTRLVTIKSSMTKYEGQSQIFKKTAREQWQWPVFCK